VFGRGKMPKYSSPPYEEALAIVREQINHFSALSINDSTMTPNTALEAIGDEFGRAVTWPEVEGRYLAKYMRLNTIR
tara:strand:- start:275 stop:505 length:231 start_codon:yes stop_codon:yes gene_type:complete